MARAKPDSLLVQDAVAASLQEYDYEQKLRSSDFQEVLEEVADKVIAYMQKEARTELWPALAFEPQCLHVQPIKRCFGSCAQ